GGDPDGRPLLHHVLGRDPDTASCVFGRITEQLMPAVDFGRGLTMGDLCSGIGGFSFVGARLGIETSFAADNKELARIWFETNHHNRHPEMFKQGRFYKDLTEIDLKQLPHVDIVTAGFPCQPFSQMGKRLGRKDPRGTIIYSIADIISATKPSAIILENSDALLSDEKGQTLADIKLMFSKIGYQLRSVVLDAADFGAVAQRRRLYLIGFRGKGSQKRFRLPKPIKRQLKMSDIVGGSCNVDVGLTVRASGLRGQSGESHNHDAYIINGAERHLTGGEARRCMGYPDDFRIPERRVDAYELLGNTVSVPLIYALMREVVTHIRRLETLIAADATAQAAAEAPLKIRVERIRGLLRQRTSTAIDIGRELIEVKNALPHGRFGPWLKVNFGLTPATARNWMGVARVFGGRQMEIEAAGLGDTALIELVRVPDDCVRETLLDQALRGELLTVAVIRDGIRKARANSAVGGNIAPDHADLGRSVSDTSLTVDRLANGLVSSITQSRVRADASCCRL
ncbi:MAG: DNA (cytosine-5-)-methyltransferase, partial [Rhodospirillaceae bacterium]